MTRRLRISRGPVEHLLALHVRQHVELDLGDRVGVGSSPSARKTVDVDARPECRRAVRPPPPGRRTAARPPLRHGTIPADARARGPGTRRPPGRALTSAIRSVPKWNTVAASTASAPAATAGGKSSARPAPPEAISGTSHHRPYGGDHLHVETAGGAVGVHRVQQDLPHPQIDAPPRPLDRVQAGALPPAVGGHPEAGRETRLPSGVDRQNQHLVAELAGDLGDHRGPVDGAGVDRHLVRAGPEQQVDVADRC